MQTWRIDGAEPLPIDPELESVLSSDSASEMKGGGIALNLGILNSEGRVYRVARSWSLADYVVACKALERLGLYLTNKQAGAAGLSFEDIFAWPCVGQEADTERHQDVFVRA